MVSLTGTVASYTVPEASIGTLKPDGYRLYHIGY